MDTLAVARRGAGDRPYHLPLARALPVMHRLETEGGSGRSISSPGPFFCPWSRFESWLALGGLVRH